MRNFDPKSDNFFGMDWIAGWAREGTLHVEGEVLTTIRVVTLYMRTALPRPRSNGRRRRISVRVVSRLFVTCQVKSCQVSAVTHIVSLESALVCAESRSWKHGHSAGCLMMVRNRR